MNRLRRTPRSRCSLKLSVTGAVSVSRYIRVPEGRGHGRIGSGWLPASSLRSSSDHGPCTPSSCKDLGQQIVRDVSMPLMTTLKSVHNQSLVCVQRAIGPSHPNNRVVRPLGFDQAIP